MLCVASLFPFTIVHKIKLHKLPWNVEKSCKILFLYNVFCIHVHVYYQLFDEILSENMKGKGIAYQHLKMKKLFCSQSISFEVGRTAFRSQRIQVGSYSVKSGPHEAPSWQSHTQHVLGGVGQVCIYWSAIVFHSLLYQCCIYTLPWNFYIL